MLKNLVKTLAATTVVLAAAKLGIDRYRDSKRDTVIVDLDPVNDGVRVFRVDSNEVFD